ncbi:exosome complex component RRP4-like isoform X2 [Xenopus laevis]|uniref:Exosome complex component RRP4-like isoform X2 n=1 Tax=Xenopus laevis TaxID=8355 RepID=A0A8J1LFU7_XENLA|nr:exosome complex component RRP4-like isoform X2 [Xenopus laevis]
MKCSFKDERFGVQQKRWKVETNSRLDSVLLLSAVNLPGGKLRRRSAEDELAMRSYLQEGDLISIKELLKVEVIEDIVMETRQRLLEQEG